MSKRVRKPFSEWSRTAKLWYVGTVVVGALLITYWPSPADKPAPTPVLVTTDPVNHLADYRDAYGGDVTGTAAAEVVSIEEEYWGLLVTMWSADPELAEWACANVKAMLSFSSRVEVWSGQTSLETC